MGFGLKVVFAPFAFLGLAVLFCMSISSSLYVGQMIGSNTVLFFIPAFLQFPKLELTSGDLWGAVFIFFNFMQIFLVGMAINGFRERNYLKGYVCLFFTVLFTVSSFVTGVMFRATDADVRNKHNQITQQAFNNLKVEVSTLHKKTQAIAPSRSPATIQADIDFLLNKLIKSRGKFYTLKSYSSSCRTVRVRTHKDCERYYRLKKELNESKDYAANKAQASIAVAAQKASVIADPNIGFAYVAELIGVHESVADDKEQTSVKAAETIEKWQILGPQLLVELLTLFGLTLIRWGMRGASMPPHGNPNQPCRKIDNRDEVFRDVTDLSVPNSMPESVDESARNAGTPSRPFKVYEGGKVTNQAKPKSHFAVCDNSSLIAFAKHVGDTNLIRVPVFMEQYRAFCELNNLRPLAKNVIGTLLEPIGGEKGHEFIEFWSETAGRYKQSKRILWRLNAENIQVHERREVA